MKDCIFCQISKGDAKSWKVYEDENVCAFFDYNPVNAYHTLIVPKKHYDNIFDIPEDELQRVMTVVKKIVIMYNQKLGIKNIQIINSSGAEAQQDVFHIHFHVVPRRTGDNQNIKRIPHIELRENFDELIEKLNQ